MPSLLNQLIHRETKAMFEAWPCAVFVNYHGFGQKDSLDLRARARKAGGQACVVKNTVTALVLKDLGHKDPERLLQGPVLVLLGKDPVALAKAALAFHKEKKKGAALGGIVEGRIVSATDVEAVSKLPSREVLVGQALSVLVGPLRGLVTVLSGNLRGLAVALNAIKEKKEKEAA